MSSDLTWWEKEARQNYVKRVFPNKKEYHYYSNLRELIIRVLESSTCYQTNPKTKQVEKVQDLSKLSFQTRRFLDTYQHLVDKCRAEHDADDLRVYGYIYVLQAMRDSSDFISQYRQLQDFLTERILECNKLTNPAENIMPDEELRIVLWEKPGLISRCAKPSSYLQYIVCDRAPWAIKYIDEPAESVVDDVCVHNRRKDSIKNILLVKPQYRTLLSEIVALTEGILKLSQINKKRLIEHDYSDEPWDWRLEGLLKTVEEQRLCLTKEELETFRLNAVGWNDNIHAIKYMYDTNNHKKPITYRDLNGVHVINPTSPGERVERKAIITHPDNIVDIKYQTPAIQQLALFCGFRAECEGRNYRFYYGATLGSILKGLKKPNIETMNVYSKLRFLIDNIMTITELEYQNEQVQIGCLRLAEAENLDVNHIYGLFKNPSANVRQRYEVILKKQAEYAYTKVSQWNPMTKRFDKQLGHSYGE